MSTYDAGLRVTQSGISVTLTSTTAVANASLPLNSNGEFPRQIRVVAASAPVIVKFNTTNSATVATDNDLFITNNPQLFNVRGLNSFSCKLHTTNPATAILNLVPIET